MCTKHGAKVNPCRKGCTNRAAIKGGRSNYDAVKYVQVLQSVMECALDMGLSKSDESREGIIIIES